MDLFCPLNKKNHEGEKARRREEGRRTTWEDIAKETTYVDCVRRPPRIRDEVHSFFYSILYELYDHIFY